MCITPSAWSPWSFHRHLPFVGYFDHLHHRGFCSLERLGLDPECLSSSTLRRHVLHARNAHLAPVEEPRRGSQEVVAIPAWSVSDSSRSFILIDFV